MREVVIVDLVRTPVGKGKPGGALSGWHPVDLLSEVLKQLVDRVGLDSAQIDDVIAGCVSQVGQQSMNVARSAVLAAGFDESVPGTTIDRQCGSSQQAVHFAAQSILAGTNDIVVACGVESMSRVPMFSPLVGQDPWGERIPQRYPGGLVNQGISAEMIAAKWKLSRTDLDEFSMASHLKAAAAQAAGHTKPEFATIAVNRGDGASEGVHAADEGIRPQSTVESLGQLRTVFRTDESAAQYPDLDWVVTAGSSSQISDGASAALLMSAERAEQLGLKPRARITGLSVTGSDPLFMLTGVIPATQKVLERAGLTVDDVDLFEVNEAFAPVVLAWQQEVNADPARVNVHGGAIANGHPLGASGVKLLTTLVNALEQRDGRRGLLTMCEGGGMANALIVETL